MQRRHLLPVLLAFMATTPWAQSSAPAVSPTACSHCVATLGNVDALRRALPATWVVQMQSEPVFGGNILTLEAGTGNAQSLLLVHGLGDNGFNDWMPVMRTLAERYHVLALDLPGFGYSDRPRGKYSPTNYAQLLAWLIKRSAKWPAIVVGHSMGGAVALRLANQHPELLSRLVLVDAAGILHRTAFVKHSATSPMGLDAAPEPVQQRIANLRNLGGVLVEKLLGVPLDPTELLRRSDAAWGLLLHSRSNVNAAMAMIDEDFSGAVHETQAPTWIIWGEADPITPLRTGQMLAARMPRASIASLPGVGHTPMISATSRFMPLLTNALTTAESAPPDVTPTNTTPLRPTLHCKGESGRQYSGRYREVIIEGCSGIRLNDLTADRIVLRDSIVEMQRVTVRGDKFALDVTNGDLRATASEFSADTAVVADGARIDFAGVKLRASKEVLQAKRHTRLIASVSQITSLQYTGYLHGAVELIDSPLRFTPATDIADKP